MECSLGNMKDDERTDNGVVLILILMECSLGLWKREVSSNVFCLNPYSNGMLTWTTKARRYG